MGGMDQFARLRNQNNPGFRNHMSVAGHFPTQTNQGTVKEVEQSVSRCLHAQKSL